MVALYLPFLANKTVTAAARAGSTALAPASRGATGSAAPSPGSGSTSGVRVVVGWWQESPYGAFADVMLAQADGTRRLLAPTDQIAAFVAAPTASTWSRWCRSWYASGRWSRWWPASWR